jgi:hypothetical protein
LIHRRPFLVISLSAAAAFILYASLFLCFFVDDEAIPLIYARNLLRGRGLVYTVLEGRVEGYSDFLHVLWSAVLLRTTSALGFSNLAPLAIGKGVSLIAGLAIVLLTAWQMRRAGVNTPGLAAGLAFLALAGPLAIWSCSSLEAAVFALMVSALAFLLFVDQAATSTSRADSSERSLPLAAVMMLGIAILFERIDGFIYLGTLLAAAWLTSGPMRRRNLLGLSCALAVIACAYGAWRYAYFGSLLSTPLAAKVLYHFTGSANQVVNAEEDSYLRSFLNLYGIGAVAVLFLAGALSWRTKAARAAAISVIVLGVYVGVVGDWMFGWRLTVALLPLTALIIAVAVTRLPNRYAWLAAAAILLWSGIAARAFVTTYVNAHRWPVFWTRVRSDASAWLQPYGDVLVASRGLISAGDRIAYNQAGIVPYALDVENIDDLGICSRFIARMPTTDVVYTRVGRYSPLRNQPVLKTAQAYLLYQNVRFLVSRTHLLRGANRGDVPEFLLDGYFRRVAIDRAGENAIYERTDKDASAFQQNTDVFRENLAHVSRLVRASIGEEVIKGRDLAARFGFLREERTTFAFDTATEVNVQFAVGDEDVSALYVDRIAATMPTTMTVLLFNAEGHEVARKQIALTPNPQSVLESFEPHARARVLSMRWRTPRGIDRVSIKDIRLEGQSGALREYVHQNLQFRD